MDQSEQARVLCVDDDANVLQGLERTLGLDFEVRTALNGEIALDILHEVGPFDVIVSDMRMPGMDGATLLARTREIAPDTQRILLTGYAEVEAAAAAVNGGGIFRFLLKPCPAHVLCDAVGQAVTQHRLLVAEKVLLEQTLRASVQVLVDVLALANPAVFGRATRIRQLVAAVLDRLGITERWHIEVAAMLSQLPLLTLPDPTLSRLLQGEPLDASDRKLLDTLPQAADHLLSHIPRLEPVREILRYQATPYGDGNGDSQGVRLPLGARILYVVLTYDRLARGRESSEALVLMQRQTYAFDPIVLDVMSAECALQATREVQRVKLSQLETGMWLMRDVTTPTGVVIIAAGHEVTPGLVLRLRNFAAGVGIIEPLHVTNSRPPPAGAS